MACRGCEGDHAAGPRANERSFRFPLNAGGIEVRTWGELTPMQVALVSQWVTTVLMGVLVDLEPREIA